MARPLLSPIALAVSLLVTVAACDRPSAEPAGEEAPPAPVDTLQVAGAADSVMAWAADIRAGIAALPARVEADPLAARQRAVELYVTRQERIEQTVGPGTGSASDLAEAVDEAEARFHDLMQLLSETPPPDSARVAGAVRALDARIGEVTDLVGRPDPGSSAEAESR